MSSAHTEISITDSLIQNASQTGRRLVECAQAKTQTGNQLKISRFD